MYINLTEEELIAAKITLRDYLESKREAFADGNRPDVKSNIHAALVAYNKMFAAQHGDVTVPFPMDRVPGWLLVGHADATRT